MLKLGLSNHDIVVILRLKDSAARVMSAKPHEPATSPPELSRTRV